MSRARRVALPRPAAHATAAADARIAAALEKALTPSDQDEDQGDEDDDQADDADDGAAGVLGPAR
jgi:hypothetical protein